MKKISLFKYVGRPYESYHCFDLVKEFYLDHYEIDLRNFYDGKDIPDKETVSTLIVSNKGNFIESEVPEFGDIVVIKLFGIESHIGVCIGGGRFIHSRKGSGSSIESLSRYKKLVSGYFRHKESK